MRFLRSECVAFVVAGWAFTVFADVRDPGLVSFWIQANACEDEQLAHDHTFFDATTHILLGCKIWLGLSLLTKGGMHFLEYLRRVYGLEASFLGHGQVGSFRAADRIPDLLRPFRPVIANDEVPICPDQPAADFEEFLGLLIIQCR
jgi:hypothetical protein